MCTTYMPGVHRPEKGVGLPDGYESPCGHCRSYTRTASSVNHWALSPALCLYTHDEVSGSPDGPRTHYVLKNDLESDAPVRTFWDVQTCTLTFSYKFYTWLPQSPTRIARFYEEHWWSNYLLWIGVKQQVRSLEGSPNEFPIWVIVIATTYVVPCDVMGLSPTTNIRKYL